MAETPAQFSSVPGVPRAAPPRPVVGEFKRVPLFSRMSVHAAEMGETCRQQCRGAKRNHLYATSVRDHCSALIGMLGQPEQIEITREDRPIQVHMDAPTRTALHRTGDVMLQQLTASEAKAKEEAAAAAALAATGATIAFDAIGGGEPDGEYHPYGKSSFDDTGCVG